MDAPDKPGNGSSREVIIGALPRPDGLEPEYDDRRDCVAI